MDRDITGGELGFNGSPAAQVGGLRWAGPGVGVRVAKHVKVGVGLLKVVLEAEPGEEIEVQECALRVRVVPPSEGIPVDNRCSCTVPVVNMRGEVCV